MLTIAMEGFCAFQMQDDRLTVFTPAGNHQNHPGHHDPHLATLIINAERVKLADTTWEPSLMFHAGEIPLFLWFLNGATVTIGNGDEAPIWQPAGDEGSLLDLSALHQGCTFADNAKHGANGLLTFRGGRLAKIGASIREFELLLGGNPVETKTFAERIQWKGDARIESNKGRIVLRDGDTSGTIANTSPGPNGMDHFSGYYDLLTLPAGAAPFGIRYKKNDPAAADDQDPIFGNCIPPAGVPRAS